VTGDREGGPGGNLELRAQLEVLRCPACEAKLALGNGRLDCQGCGKAYPIEDGIPLLFVPNEWKPGSLDVTDDIRRFYEVTPFPDYDEFDSVGSLMQKARRGLFAKLLDDQIPARARIAECGCGTGQLSNFLSISNREVFGTDLCLNSLRLAQAFKSQNRLERVHFLQMNLFRPALARESFDLVISNGVLHHTANPRLGFESIARLVKPGGFVLIGLYHRYGRLITDARRMVFRLFGDRFAALDPNLRRGGFASAKRRAWFMDQYKNPHESKHTIGEVLGWLRQAGFDFVKSLPRSRPFQPIAQDEPLFVPEEPGNAIERLMVELGMIATGSREGGFFTIIARKPRRERAAAPAPRA
jgi:SAM-dependent methyltransferase